MGLIGFDITTPHRTLGPTQNAVRRFLKIAGLTLPEAGLWGPYVKHTSRSRIEFAYPFDGTSEDAMAQMVAYDTAFGAADLGEERPDQRAHAAMQSLRSLDELQKQTGLWHVVPYAVDIQPDINWVHIQWTPDDDAAWDQLMARGQWVVLNDYRAERGDPDLWGMRR